MTFSDLSSVYPMRSNGYVDCPRNLFYWFVGESQRMYWEYVESPEFKADCYETVSVMQPYYDNFKGRMCYRKVEESRFDEEQYYYGGTCPPDKLDGCIDAAYWLSEVDPDWVTPDWFTVDVERLGRLPWTTYSSSYDTCAA